jgi:hypothetical protein
MKIKANIMNDNSAGETQTADCLQFQHISSE